MDRQLDQAKTGPLYLRMEPIATIVCETLLTSVAVKHYQLGAFVIMPNHVHVLVFPMTPPSQLLKSIKGVTAREANKVLGRTGEQFWQHESYDHYVRNDVEREKIVAYIENNSVKAGLALTPADFK